MYVAIYRKIRAQKSSFLPSVWFVSVCPTLAPRAFPSSCSPHTSNHGVLAVRVALVGIRCCEGAHAPRRETPSSRGRSACSVLACHLASRHHLISLLVPPNNSVGMPFLIHICGSPFTPCLLDGLLVYVAIPLHDTQQAIAREHSHTEHIRGASFGLYIHTYTRVLPWRRRGSCPSGLKK